jgi:hypothetical protein
VLSILNAIHPGDPRYTPSAPTGKAPLAAVAAMGHAYESLRFAGFERLIPPAQFRLYGGANQYDLAHPTLKNPDGTPVIAHPDVVLADAVSGAVLLDEEVKTVSDSYSSELPRKTHLEQRLLRQYIWRSHGHNPCGRIHYAFRDTPESAMDYNLIPSHEGMIGFWAAVPDSKKLYSWELLEELNKRLCYIADCVENRVIPDRLPAENYECRLKRYGTQCPFRASCWPETAATLPLIAAETLKKVAEYAEITRKKAEHDKVSFALKNRQKEIQDELSPLLAVFGDELKAGSYLLARSLVDVPCRVGQAYSFYRYVVKTV